MSNIMFVKFLKTKEIKAIDNLDSFTI